uniref:Candidate secreted effector n=1 Tax=Meloidogyne incognita TaxID=6306 RepID=A0A914N5X2_MELIC
MTALTLKTCINFLICLVLLQLKSINAQNLAPGQTDFVLLPCTLKIEAGQYPCEQQQLGGNVLFGDQMPSNQQQSAPSISPQYEAPQSLVQMTKSPLLTSINKQPGMGNTPQSPLQQQPQLTLPPNFRLTKLADLVQILPEIQQSMIQVVEPSEPENIEFVPTPPSTSPPLSLAPQPTSQIPLTLPMVALPLCQNSWLSIASARLCPVQSLDTAINGQSLLTSPNAAQLQTPTSFDATAELQNYLTSSPSVNGLSQPPMPRSTPSLNKIASSPPLNKNNLLFLPTSKTTNFNFANSPRYLPYNNIQPLSTINGNIKNIGRI